MTKKPDGSSTSSAGDNGRLSGKRVVVTGAGSGIGRATSMRLIDEGAIVLGVDRDHGGLEGTASLVREAGFDGGNFSFAVGSILDEAFLKETFEKFAAAAGGLDVLVNLAGILRLSKVEDTSLAAFLEIVTVNLGGTFLVSKEAMSLLEASQGCIINAASTSALFGHPYVGSYAASKGGIISLTKAMAWEFMRRGVRVNAVAPGAIATPMQSGPSGFPAGADFSLFDHLTLPGGAEGRAEHVAGVIAMLASEDGRHINGEVIRIDGGLHS